MSSSFEKSVKGATKIKAAPPKSKYIEHILIATHSGEHGVADVFKALQNRLRDSTWTVVFKSLIVVHMMIREGSPDATLAYLARHRNMLAISSFSDVQTQGRNIRHYTNYLSERARAFRDTKCDFVKSADHRLEKMTVEKGLLRETETVQHQITALLKCDVLDNEPDNEITVVVFRMLVLDLLAMFNVMNQAMINILGHFFEMSRPDAERSMEIYRNFTKQTDFVVAYLSTARQYEHQTRVEVPKLKHAPVNLGKQLEDYLMDPDFEINRRQYIAEQESKKGRGTNSASKASAPAGRSESQTRSTVGKMFPDMQPSASKVAQPTNGPAPDLIDFFGSIEQSQQPVAQQAPPQLQNGNGNPFQQMQSSYGQQQNDFGAPTNPYQIPNQFQQQQQQSFNTGFQAPQQQPIQPNFTGAGFGGYTPQPFQVGGLSSIPQDQAATFQQQQPPQALGSMQTGAQATNPFRQSMVSTTTGMPQSSFTSTPPNPSLQRQSTNPFAKSSPQVNQQSFSQPSHQFQAQTAPLPSTEFQRPMAIGTNPFARNMSMSAASSRPDFDAPARNNTMNDATPRPNFDRRPQTSGSLMPQATGSTNPFRQSQFVNTATGSGWQNNQQPIGGGLDSMQTLPIFPRPTQQQPWGM